MATTVEMPLGWVVRAPLVGPSGQEWAGSWGSWIRHPPSTFSLSPEDVFIQQTQDVRNPVIYAVFTSSG